MDKDIDILCVTEHWLSVMEIGSTQLCGYRVAGYYARESSKGGGVALFVKDILSSSIDVQKFLNQYNVEKCIECSLNFIKNLNVYVLVVYRSPSGNFDTFLTEIEGILTTLGPGKSVILAGDFNVHFNTREINTLQLCDTLTSFDLHQQIFDATRHDACLDNIFVSSDMDVLSTRVLDLDLSDHLGLIVEISVDLPNTSFS